MERKKDSAREETRAVSGTMRISVQNRHQKPLDHLNHQHKEVEMRPGKRTSEATAVQRITGKVLASSRIQVL